MNAPGPPAAPVRHHPLSWRDWAASPRTQTTAPRTLGGAIIQRWEGSARQMNQPPLDHHYLVVHLGGDKRVTRTHAGRSLVRDVRNGSFSAIAAGSAYRWRTAGPIAFGHVYLEPDWFARTIGEGLDQDHARIDLHEEVGTFDPLIGQLLSAIVRASATDDVATMQQEAALETLLLRLFERQSNAARLDERVRISVASVRRVCDFIAANLDHALTLDELAQVAGYSRFHFVRGFRAATGMPPYAYLLHQRIARACEMLGERGVPIAAIAAATGFATHAQFSSRFRQMTGVAPTAFREMLR